jgi:hypothetical protein
MKGAGELAFAGVQSPTRLQQEYKMKLASQQQANQIYAAMDAEIRKMPIEAEQRIKIENAMARFKATGEIAVAFATLDPELQKIMMQAYTNAKIQKAGVSGTLSPDEEALGWFR